jgi:hypothetical protein
MNKQEIIQSRLQRVYVSLYKAIVSLVVYFLIAAILFKYFDIQPQYTSIAAVAVLAPTAYTLFMWFVHPEPICKIVFNNKGFEFHLYEDIREISWSDYEGYSVSKIPLKHIKIRVREMADIEFDFYTFSAEQRKKMFSLFELRRA